MSKCWDGTQVGRVRSGDERIAIYNPRVSLHLLMQPIIAAGIFRDPLLVGQGFLPRFLLSFPSSNIGERPYLSVDPNESQNLQRYWRQMTEILKQPLPLDPLDGKYLEPGKLNVSPAAKESFINFYNSTEVELKRGHPLSHIVGFAAKSADYAIRLAGILTCVNDLAANQIELPQMNAGIELMKFYISEASRLSGGVVCDPKLVAADVLLGWLHTQTDEVIYLGKILRFSPRPIRLPRKEMIELIVVLEEHGWLHKVDYKKPLDGSPRTDVWEIIRA